MSCLRSKNIFWAKNDEGFSSVGVVLALLLTLALVFSTAQVYRVSSASADIQNVADSSALSAENEVAEFMILVRVCDSVVLSLSMGGLVAAALGAVALCIPFTAEIGTTLLEISVKIFNARDSFANKTSSGLDKIQKALPFICAVKAYQVAVANNGGTFDAKYLAITFLMPGEGVEIKPGNIDEARGTVDDINSGSEEVKKAAAEAEEAAKEANEAKQRAFNADCGNNPNYCMYERALNKAGMSDGSNPLYRSMDTWGFSVALKRAQAYYPKRLQIEAPEGSSIEEQENSALRKVFYRYASQQMQNGYVWETDDAFSANFPHLPKNTEEMKTTTMYTNPIFPITNNGSSYVIHAWDGCPNCVGVAKHASIQEAEASNYVECDKCHFKASSLGKVAAASSTIDNGFEYHYSIVEQAAKDYQKAIEKAKPASDKVKNKVGGWLDKIKNLIKDVFSKRIYAKPPGSYGAIAMVVNTSSAPVSSGFENTFVSSGKSLGVRVAFSGATLIEESSDQGKNVITSILDGLKKDLPGVAGAGGILLACWGKLLEVYSGGQDAFMSAIESGLNSLPLVSQSGLGTWAAKNLTSLMEGLGLESANLEAIKPVLINTEYIAIAGKKETAKSAVGKASVSFSTKYLSVKQQVAKVENLANDALKKLASVEEIVALLNLGESGDSKGTIEIATITPLGDWGPSIPITITLPKFATNTMNEITNWMSGAIQGLTDAISGRRVWR